MAEHISSKERWRSKMKSLNCYSGKFDWKYSTVLEVRRKKKEEGKVRGGLWNQYGAAREGRVIDAFRLTVSHFIAQLKCSRHFWSVLYISDYLLICLYLCLFVWTSIHLYTCLPVNLFNTLPPTHRPVTMTRRQRLPHRVTRVTVA